MRSRYFYIPVSTRLLICPYYTGAGKAGQRGLILKLCQGFPTGMGEVPGAKCRVSVTNVHPTALSNSVYRVKLHENYLSHREPIFSAR
jgi:hypothetical protein